MIERSDNTVLVVEDNPVLSLLLCLLLTRSGYEVATVTNGQEALDYLDHHPAPFLITLDMNMPVMGGEEFLRHRADSSELCAIPVFLCSGSVGEEGTEVAEAYGVSFCAKPSRADELLKLVEQHHVAMGRLARGARSAAVDHDSIPHWPGAIIPGGN